MMSYQNLIQQHPYPFLKTPDGQKQLHIIGVEQQTDVVENHRYSADKPNETQSLISLEEMPSPILIL
jgi:hypothetical protein